MPEGTTEAIAERLETIVSRVGAAARSSGRRPEDIVLVGVSKKQPAEKLREAYKAGLRDFGENYLQGYEEHAAVLGADARWHFIGHVQSKKAKRVSGCHLIHTLDSLKLAKLLGQAGATGDTPVRALVQINISCEPQKAGILPDEAPAFFESVQGVEGLSIEGLMCIPDPTRPARPAFAALREHAEGLRRGTGLPLPELSMGMSSSFEEAIAEGATIVRVGTAIFGTRSTDGQGTNR